MIERPLDIKGVSIVPLKTTARFQWRLNWSKGYVSTRALQQSLALVEAAPAEDLKFVACHHPLVEAGTRMSSRTRLGAEALAALASAGADAVLTGHVHDPFDVAHEVGGRSVRLIGAGTLSERVRAHPALVQRDPDRRPRFRDRSARDGLKRRKGRPAGRPFRCFGPRFQKRKVTDPRYDWLERSRALDRGLGRCREIDAGGVQRQAAAHLVPILVLAVEPEGVRPRWSRPTKFAR